MFRFENPEFLYLYIAMPFVVVLYIILNIKKRNDVKRLGFLPTIKQMMPELSLKRSYLKFWLIFGALCAGIFMIARPQFGTKVENVEKEGIELVIAIDVSNSMLARDVGPDRLTRAKQILSRLIDVRKNDKVALVVFAGEAYVQMPLTVDTQSAKIFLNSIDTNIVPVQGTAISDAINLSINSFSSDTDVDKAIILITDAEDHEGNAYEVAKQAADAGIMVNVIGIGSTEGSPIPESPTSDRFRSDDQGQIVVTKLNEQLAQEIAVSGKGMYIQADNTNSAINALEAELNELQSKTSSSLSYSEYDEKYILFAWLMLLILVIEFLVYDKKNPIFKNVRLFK